MRRIIPRAEWGARYSNGAYYQGKPIILPLPYSETWFHHSAGRYLPPTATFEEEVALMREIEQIGQDRFGQGISYTWLDFPSGRIYEGHGVDRRGTHTGGRNDIARAVCFPGNYDVQRLTDAQQMSASWLLQYTHRQGWSRNRTANGGHRDVKATACPGAHAYRAIPDINTRAVGPLIITEEDDVSWTDPIAYPAGPNVGKTVDAGPMLGWTNYYAGQAVEKLVAIAVKLDALAGDLRDDEANVIAAMRQIVEADQDVELTITDEQVAALGARLAAALPAGVTEAQMQEAVRQAFARAGATPTASQ